MDRLTELPCQSRKPGFKRRHHPLPVQSRHERCGTLIVDLRLGFASKLRNGKWVRVVLLGWFESPVQLVVVAAFAAVFILPVAIGIWFFFGRIKKDRDTRDKPS
jgi:hypothetical protein